MLRFSLINYAQPCQAKDTVRVLFFFPASCARMCMSPGYALSSCLIWKEKRKEMEQLYFSISVQLDEIDFV